MLHRVHTRRQADLVQVAQTSPAVGRMPRIAQRRQQQRHDDRDDGDHHR